MFADNRKRSIFVASKPFVCNLLLSSEDLAHLFGR